MKFLEFFENLFGMVFLDRDLESKSGSTDLTEPEFTLQL